jgi:hypothetical protein
MYFQALDHGWLKGADGIPDDTFVNGLFSAHFIFLSKQVPGLRPDFLRSPPLILL